MAVLVTFVGLVYLALSWNHRSPSIYADEAGTLGNARWLTGGPVWWMGGANSTRLGYPLLVAPVFALVHSPVTIYRVLMAVNALLCAALAGLLSLLARAVLGARPRVARASALTACAYPAIAVQSGIAWVEVAAMVAVAVFVLTALRMLERPRFTTMLGHAAAGVYLWLVHGRFVAVPLLLLALLGYLAARDRALRTPAIATMALTVVALIVGHVAQDAQLRARVVLPQTATHIGLHEILTAGPTALTRQLGGTLAYLLIATLGLAAVGVAVLTQSLQTSARRGLAALPARIGPIYVLAALGSVVVIPAAYLAAATSGADQPSYHLFTGRYGDALTPMLLALGIAAVLSHPRRAMVVRSLGVASGAIAVLGLLVVATVSGHGRIGTVRWLTAPGIRPFFAGDTQNRLHSRAAILVVTVIAAVCVGCLALAVARRFRWSVGVAVLTLFIFVAARDVSTLAPHYANVRKSASTYLALRARRPKTVAYELDHRTPFGYFGLPYWLNESTFVGFKSSSSTWPQADLYIGPINWPEAAPHGLQRLVIDSFSNQGVWISGTA